MLPEDVDPETGEMTFVFTDIMNSTDAAIANPQMMQVFVLFCGRMRRNQRRCSGRRG